MDPDYAARYRDLYRHHWWFRAREELIVAELRRLRPARGWGRILDVGCGDGLFFPRLQEFGEVEGVEPDPAMRSGASGSRIHAGPFETFRPGRRYSLILMLDVVEHVRDAVGFVRHALAILEDEGTLLLTVPAFRILWTTHDLLNRHLTRYTKRSFRRVANQAGMRVDRMQYFFHALFLAKLAVRMFEAVTGARPEPPRVPGRALNRAAYLVSRTEQAILGRVPVPLGSSLLAVGGRRTA